MTEPEPIPITAMHYRFMGAIGLALLVIGQHVQDVPPIVNAIVGALGIWMLLFPGPRMPLLFVVLAAVVQLLAHLGPIRSFGDVWIQLRNGAFFVRPFTLFEPTTLLLSGGILIFVGAQLRLAAIKWHVVPPDPRFPSQKVRDDAGRLIAPQTRPEAVLTPEEIVRFVVVAAVCVALSQWGWAWLNQGWALGEIPPRVVQIIVVVWLVVVGIFVGAGIVGYWRRAHGSPDTARMYLQEIAWSEARREYGRIGRWLAWGKRKMRKRRKI